MSRKQQAQPPPLICAPVVNTNYLIPTPPKKTLQRDSSVEAGGAVQGALGQSPFTDTDVNITAQLK